MYNSTLACWSAYNKVDIEAWDTETGTEVMTLLGHDEATRTITRDPLTHPCVASGPQPLKMLITSKTNATKILAGPFFCAIIFSVISPL